MTSKKKKSRAPSVPVVIPAPDLSRYPVVGKDLFPNRNWAFGANISDHRTRGLELRG